MTTKGIILEQAAPSTTRVPRDGDGSNPAVAPETEAEADAWQAASPWVHGLLGVASFVPGLSVVTGAADAAIYAAEGDYVEAGIAAASMIPGGKVVTTAGKAAKGAVAMVRGTGTAAKVAKSANATEDVVNAARASDEVASVVNEANAVHKAENTKAVADDASVRGSKVQQPKNEVTIKAKKRDVPCFHPFDKTKFMQMSHAAQKAYLKEMARQLRRQQDLINNLTATEYLAARKSFNALERNPAAASAQKALRKSMQVKITSGIRKTLVKRGMDPSDAKMEAVARAKKVMSELAALHDPDMVAGGWLSPDPTGMGRSDVNSSIGASWNQEDRVLTMDNDAKSAVESGRGDHKMDVKLEPCRGKDIRELEPGTLP